MIWNVSRLMLPPSYCLAPQVFCPSPPPPPPPPPSQANMPSLKVPAIKEPPSLAGCLFGVLKIHIRKFQNHWMLWAPDGILNINEAVIHWSIKFYSRVNPKFHSNDTTSKTRRIDKYLKEDEWENKIASSCQAVFESIQTVFWAWNSSK